MKKSEAKKLPKINRFSPEYLLIDEISDKIIAVIVESINNRKDIHDTTVIMNSLGIVASFFIANLEFHGKVKIEKSLEILTHHIDMLSRKNLSLYTHDLPTQ